MGMAVCNGVAVRTERLINRGVEGIYRLNDRDEDTVVG